MTPRRGLTALASAALVATSLLAGSAPAQAEPDAGDDPVIALAGDIACSPDDAEFNGGAGTDSGCQMRLTSDLVTPDNVRMVVALGDTQYEDGTASAFAASYDRSWGRVLDKTMAVIGNHEYHTAGGAPFRAYFGTHAAAAPSTLMTVDGSVIGAPTWRFYGLDTNCERPEVHCSDASLQNAELEADLEAHPRTCVLAVGHHPRWSSGSHGGTPELEPMLRTLREAHAEVYVAGHEHDYERFWKMREDGTRDGTYGLRTFVAGLGGKESRPFAGEAPGSLTRITGTSGVLMMTLHEDTYDYRFVEAGTRRVLDSGTGQCRR